MGIVVVKGSGYAYAKKGKRVTVDEERGNRRIGERVFPFDSYYQIRTTLYRTRVVRSTLFISLDLQEIATNFGQG